MKQKYQPVLGTIQKEGAQLQNRNLDGNQTVSESHSKVGGQQESYLGRDPRSRSKFADLKHDIEFSQADQTYTVQPGDTLSKISKQFYGDPNQYTKIAQANKLDDPDKIKAGQQLLIQRPRPRALEGHLGRR